MNDQQLVIGVVFIIAGIAVALLAYAAYLNREQPAEEAEETEQTPPSSDAPGGEQPEPAAASDAHEVPPAKARAATAAEPPSGAPPGPESTPDAPGPVRPEGPAGPAPTVELKRNEQTGRLNVEIDGRTYRSIEELRGSADWKEVDDLFRDILAWLVKEQPAPEETLIPEEAPTPEQPLNMVQQINQILVEKLDSREEGPKAVRLMEGTGGTIRVYIGMDSYPIDEVPDEEVQAIIRQAVKEWEAQQ